MLDTRSDMVLLETGFEESQRAALLDLQGEVGGAAWDELTLSSWLRVPGVEVRFLREVAHPDAPIAFYVLHFSTRAGVGSLYLANLGVAHAWRRRGVGRYALQCVEEHARRRKAQRIVLHVQESNLPAQLLYRSMGYVAVEIERAGYGDEDAYRMVRELR